MSNVTQIDQGDSLKELREGLSKSHRKIMKAILPEIERELIDSLPELEDGVNTSGASGSVSITLAIRAGKRGRFLGKLSARVRTPRESIEFDFHVGDDNQLELGLPPGWDEGTVGDEDED